MTETTTSPGSASSDTESSHVAPQEDVFTYNTVDGKTPKTAIVVAESLEERLSTLPDTGRERNRNPFSDPDVALYYATLYEKAQYECRHVFDPTLEWTQEEEKKLVRKLDWHVCLWAVSLVRSFRGRISTNNLLQCVMFFALQIDRGNLGRAVSDNMLGRYLT